MQRLDSYIKVTTPSTYIALAALTVLFISVGVWVFFGSVTDKAYLKGVIFPRQGAVSVDLPHQGTVRAVYVHKGDKVVKGQQLALVSIDGSFSILSSPCDGSVLSYLIEGEGFDPFQSIVNLLANDAGQIVTTVTAFANFKESRDIKANMPVQITPTYDSRERIGYINGFVETVIPYPISRAEAEEYFENKSIVNEIFPEDGAVFIIGIRMRTDPDDPGALDWSFKSDEVLDTGVGTYCNVRVIVKSRSLSRYLFESIKEKKQAANLWKE